MVKIRLSGEWLERQVRCRWTAGTFDPPEEARRAIEAAWAAAASRPGVRLFDGPMCRLEGLSAEGDHLELALSRTSYKAFMGTNISNAHLADRYGGNCLANPVGLSSALVSRDGFLLLGLRNQSVAYYPGRIHPFAGALEPADDVNVFDEARRELREELALTEEDIEGIGCIGMVEDPALRQPELVFLVRSVLDREQIDSRLDSTEHAGMLAVAPDAGDIQRMLDDSRLTPVAAGTLMLWSRRMRGEVR